MVGQDGGVDWAGFERALTDALVRAIGAAAVHPGRRLYAAALYGLYRETDGVITIPSLAANTVEALHGRESLRWSPADWCHLDDGWLPDGTRWERALTAYACRGSTRQWDAALSRFLAVLVRVCRNARKTLPDRDCVVLLLDDAHHESLLRRVLGRAELYRLFPEYDAKAAALSRVAALPAQQRAEYHVSRLGTFDGEITGEEAAVALRRLGIAATRALVPLLAIPERAWEAAMLLAEIGRADPDVIAALETAVGRLDGADRSWAACALARLGRLDAVLSRIDRLPPDVVVSAVVAPYTAFRDRTDAPPPLDYRPLTDFLERWPAHAPAVAAQLRPGSSYCEISRDEVGAAIRGLSSPHVVVRQHAACVLGRRGLGARTVLPALCRTVAGDPEPDVRRLAVLSLLWWQKDSIPYERVVRAALDDPDATVREAAGYWFDGLMNGSGG
jgi:hypothetical protein